MVLMVVCGLLLLLGVAGVVVWGGAKLRPPVDEGVADCGSVALAARRYVWYLAVAVVAGVGSGLLVAGAGGRLVMRLLAVTADDAAQGRETEAEEIVGRISTGGTVSFIIFAALFLGLASGVLYMLIRRWLPDGRLGGLTYGMLLLVIAATRIDPLRADNPDFDIVGPGWVAASTLGALVLLHGMLVAALAARYSGALPVVTDRRSLLAYTPLLVLLPVFPIYGVLAIVGGVVVALRRRLKTVAEFARSRKAHVGGRMILAGMFLAALPGCISAVADVAARQP
ncbi:MAG: hypothetical protein ACRDLS_00035 [Solirubrobacteraceae bacterium]